MSAAWTIVALILVSTVQTRSTPRTWVPPGWHLPTTIEVLRDVDVLPSFNVVQERRGTLYAWTLHPPRSFRIKSGERFQMVKVYFEGECRIRFKKEEYDLNSCHWLAGFSDPEADIYRVLNPPR